jgi:hypothetical protein
MRVSSGGLLALCFTVWVAACGEPPTSAGAGPVTLDTPAKGRPAGVSEGPRAAVILAVNGAATVTPGRGEPFAAKPDQELLADDTITTAEGGLVVLELHNRHVVRMTPGGTLRVDALAVYGEPPAGDDVAQRFAALLSPRERDDGALQVASRVAGWNMRMTATQTFAPQVAPPASDQPAPPRLDEPLEGIDGIEGIDPPPTVEAPSGGVARPADAKTPTKKRADSNDDDIKDPFGRGPDGGESKIKPKPEPESKPPTNEKASESDDVGSKSTTPPGSADLPDFVEFQPAAGGKSLRVSLPAPLAQRRAELAACVSSKAVIRAQIKAHKFVAVTVDGATLACMKPVIGKSVGLDDGWIELRVQP